MRLFTAVILSLLCLNINCDKKPNVLFIVVDDFRTFISAYGDPIAITPNIDKLARIGYLFQNAYAQQAVCGPSRTSFLTSRRPDSTRVIGNRGYKYWRKNVGNFTTIPQHFKQSGYYTVNIGKIFHPGPLNGHDDVPFSWSQKPYHPSTVKYTNHKVCPPVLHETEISQNVVCPVDISTQPEGTLPDIQSVDYAVDFINKYNKDKPLFLAVGLRKPHLPLKYPKEFLNYYPLSTIPLPENRTYPKKLPTVAWEIYEDFRSREDIKSLNVSFPFGPIPEFYQRLIRQSYYAATTYMDTMVGRLLKAYEKKFTFNNTIISFIGDHGYSLGEHGEWAKYSNFDLATRVPMIIALPQQYRDFQRTNNLHKQVTEYVELVDLFPTLADLANIPVPPICDQKVKQDFCTEGMSMRRLIERRESEPKWKKYVFSQYPRPSVYPRHDTDQPRLEDANIMGYTMKNETLRYTEWVKFDPLTFKPHWSKVYARELYLDRGENDNFASEPKYQKLIKQLSVDLRKGWRGAIVY